MARMIYKPCIDKPKPPLIIKPTAEDLKDMETNFRVLPLFEKSSYEKARIKTLSMDLNEKLKCCWTKYKQNLEMRDKEPFCFPDVRDVHYRKYLVEYLPSERKFKFDNRMKMKAGPGVDYRGQMPIPHELLMVRGDTKSKQDRIKLRREKNEKRKVVEKKKVK
uniref:SFRICE_034043 n=1 Tax=Spodoptera frugiperda TaxID=7108 RepID=A0A2H1VES8_SPOFR